MKIISDYCIRCGKERKLREKSNGCFHWGKFIAKNHLYTYEKESIEDMLIRRGFRNIHKLSNN